MSVIGPQVPRQKQLTFDEFQAAVVKTIGLDLDKKEVYAPNNSLLSAVTICIDKSAVRAARGAKDRANELPEMERDLYAGQ